jgi:hypothetical protein
MKKTYTDECLERTKIATEGPWKTYKTHDASFADGIRQEQTQEDIICGSIDYEQRGVYTQADAEFIAHARTDVPELARRLNRAIEALKSQVGQYDIPLFKDLIEELEAPLEKK